YSPSLCRRSSSNVGVAAYADRHPPSTDDTSLHPRDEFSEVPYRSPVLASRAVPGHVGPDNAGDFAGSLPLEAFKRHVPDEGGRVEPQSDFLTFPREAADGADLVVLWHLPRGLAPLPLELPGRHRETGKPEGTPHATHGSVVADAVVEYVLHVIVRLYVPNVDLSLELCVIAVGLRRPH